MREELTMAELEGQCAELLPMRETLYFRSNWAGVVSTNSSLALNAASALSSAKSTAYQQVFVWQH